MPVLDRKPYLSVTFPLEPSVQGRKHMAAFAGIRFNSFKYMNYSTVLLSLAGGALIGLAAALLLYFNNRVAGISGIAAGVIKPWQSDSAWRLAFLIGLILSASVWFLFGGIMPIQLDSTVEVLALSGLLVGYGTQLGNGCTSGHGICGLARLSTRSMVATACFMITAGLTVYGVHHVL
jgi:uncharacterized protein